MFYKKQHPTYWKYDDSYILGNTIQNIESRYGRFDFTKKDSNNNGNKRKIIECSYLVAKKRVGFFGTIPAKYYIIVFENDVAIKLKIDTTPGG